MMDLLTVDVGMIIDGGVVVKIMACEVDLKNRFPCEFSSKSSALVLWPSVGRGFSPKATRENGKTCVASNGHKYSHFFLLCQKTLNCQLRLLFLPWIELNFLCCTRDVEGAAAAVSSFVGESSRRNFTFLKRSRRREKNV